MPMLGDVFLDMVKEDAPEHSLKVSEHPIENKQKIVDHTEMETLKLSLSGVIVGKDAEQRKLKLLNYMKTSKLLKYSYVNAYQNMIITSFRPLKDKNISNGFNFEITLEQVRIVKVALVTELPKAIKKKVAPVGNKGLQQKKTKKPVKKPVKKTAGRPNTGVLNKGVGQEVR